MDENGTPVQPGQTPPPPPPQQPPTQPAYPPQQPAAPQAPVQPQYSQPPAAAQPGYGMPPQPGQAPPAKKKPIALILILVAVVGLLCALTACGFGVFALINSGANDQEILDEADVHYDTVSAMVEDIDTHYDAFLAIEGDDASAEREEQWTVSESAIAEARAELTAAQDLILSMSDSETKDLYAESLMLMDTALYTYEALYAGLPAKLDLVDELDVMFDELSTADSQLSDSVDETNAGNYSAAKKQAEAAKATYESAVQRLGVLEQEYPGLGIEQQIAIEQLYVDAATAASNAADAGSKGDESTYNKHVDAYDVASDGIDTSPWPEWSDDLELLLAPDYALYEEAWGYVEASWETYDLSVEAWDSEGF